MASEDEYTNAAEMGWSLRGWGSWLLGVYQRLQFSSIVHVLFNVFMYLFIYWRDLILQKNELAVLNVPFSCSDPDGDSGIL